MSLMSAAAISLLPSSSPPTAFEVDHSKPRSNRGGLTSLLGSSYRASVPSHSVGSDASLDLASCSTQTSSTSHFDSGAFAYSQWESVDCRSSAASNNSIHCSSSSLRLKDRSPVSVLHGFSVGSKQHLHSHTHLQEHQHHVESCSGTFGRPVSALDRAIPSEGHAFATSTSPSISRGDSRRPTVQRLGFHVGRDSNVDLRVMATDSSDSTAVLSPKTSWGEVVAPLHFGVNLASSVGGNLGMDISREPSFADFGSSLSDARARLERMANGNPALVDSPGENAGTIRSQPSLSLEDDQDLLSKAQMSHPIFYDPLVKKAFNVAAYAHQGQLRKDGQPYVTHCLATAVILAESGSDKLVVAAGLLHDVLDDSSMDEAQLRSIFGDEVSDLVIGVSKLSKFSQLTRDSKTAVNPSHVDRLRTMFLAMVDVRVVLVKLADRLHNLRTLSSLPHHKQLRVAKESLEVFAPLANRLGIWSWKAEMEDTCFRFLDPEEYAELAGEMEKEGGKESVIASIRRLDEALREAGVQFEDLSGRPKNLYSVYQKMTKKGRRVSEILDIRGLRLIVSDKESCFKAMDVVKKLWKPLSGEKKDDWHFKDYISKPKPNGYQSLHCVVQGENGHTLEVQIRSLEMHNEAEYRFAAHWNYKEGGEGSPTSDAAEHSRSVSSLHKKVAWARYVLSWHAELDKKMRITPATGSIRPPCPFPVHNAGCEFGDECQLAGALQESECDPVFVILMEDEEMSVQKVPAGSMCSDLLRALREKESNKYSGMSVKLSVNQEIVDDVTSRRLQMGDLVELSLEIDEFDVLGLEPYPSQLLPAHATTTMADIGVSHPHVELFMVEMERQRLNNWFSGKKPEQQRLSRIHSTN